MRPLKIPVLWLTLGWTLVAAACFGSLIPGSKVPVPSQYDKLLHGGTYLILMVWFAGIYERRRYPVIAALLTLLGIALEFGQQFAVSRMFDHFDLTANVAGIVVGLSLALTILGGWCQQVEGWMFGRAGGSS